MRKYKTNEVVRNFQSNKKRTKVNPKSALSIKLPQSNTFYRQVLESLEDYAVFTIDSEGKVISWNKGAQRLLGYTPEEILGENTGIIFTLEDRQKDAPQKEMNLALKKGKAKDERWHMRRDGTRFWGSGVLFPFKQGKEKGFTKILRDLTERKQAEEAFKRSEKRFRTLLEYSYDAIVLTSSEGKAQYASPSIKNVIGYTPEEYLTLDAAKLVHPDDLKSASMFFREIIRKPGTTFPPYHTRYLDKYGSYRWIEYTATNFLNDPGITAVVFNFRDITSQKLTEERQLFLEEASNILGSSIDYETTLKNIGELIIPFLADYCRIVVVGENKNIKEIVARHVDPQKLPLVKQLYAAYKDNKANTHGVEKLITSGETEFMEQVSQQIYNSVDEGLAKIMRKLKLESYIGVPMKIGNKVVGALTFSSTRKGKRYTLEDVSLAEELARRAAIAIENARLYKEAQKEIAERKKLEKQKDEFIGVASHELKTPVTSIKSFGQVLRMKFAKEGNYQAAELLGKMDIQINRLTSLISDLLDVTKIEAGKIQFNERYFTFDVLVDELIEELQRTTQKHRLIKKGKTEQIVFGDRERIGQVITNFIVNAIKYSPKSGQIIITSLVQKNKIMLSVQDFGIGIPREKQGKVFERFFRVSGPGKETYPGLGLGLYISSEIIKRSQGKIWVESTEGKGSTFCFMIPLSKKKEVKHRK